MKNKGRMGGFSILSLCLGIFAFAILGVGEWSHTDEEWSHQDDIPYIGDRGVSYAQEDPPTTTTTIPSEPPPIGYEFLDDNKVVHIWNTQDDYYFNKSSGIQLTNHYQDYWTRNIFCIGYYDGNAWNKINCADELSGFNRDIITDNETYVNATLWKDISYLGYDMRLGVGYHLGLNDETLSITIYGKNLGIDIPFDLGFVWKVTDVNIPESSNGKSQPCGDSIEINNTRYKLNDTMDLLFKNMSHYYFDDELNETIIEYDSHLRMQDWTKFLRVDWNENLNYAVKMVGNENQENFYVALLINAGHFNPQQEKSTTFYWIDAEGDYITKWSLNVGNTVPQGITTDGTNILVVDNNDDVFVYDMSGDYVKAWDLDGNNALPYGIGNNGTNIWVVDNEDDEVYVYNISGGYITKWALEADNTNPQGITTDGTNILVVDVYDNEVYVYNMSGNYTTKWTLNAEQEECAYGITTDGTNIWVVDNYWENEPDEDETYKYDMSGNYITKWSLETDNVDSYGITTNGTYFWVVDYTDDEVYVYELTPLPDETPPTYSLNSTNSTTAGTEVLHSLKWEDDVGLSGYIFQFCNGTWNGSYCLGEEGNWDISAAVYNDINISTEDTCSGGLFFKSDGIKLYVIGNGNNLIYQYTCSDAWNLSSCTYDNVNISIQDEFPNGLFFKSDGTKLYELGDADIYQYTCSNAWNLSSCEYDTVKISTVGTESGDLFFKPDGTKLYEISTWPDNLINQYTCSDAWNLSSCTYDDVNISTQDPSPEGLFFKPDGTKLYETGVDTDKIYQYTCSDAWNLSSCTYDDVNISTQDSTNQPTGIFFSPDGAKLYEIGHNNNKIYEYVLLDSSGWVNDTWVSMGGTTNWSNVSKLITSDIGVNVSWCVHANDTSDNWNSSSCDNPFVYVTTTVGDEIAPTLTINLPQSEQNYSSLSVELNVTATDETEMDTCIYSLDRFATNNSFSNYTSIGMTAVEGRNVVNVSCNDTSGNENRTGVIFHVDTKAPTMTRNLPETSGSTISDSSFELNITAVDIGALCPQETANKSTNCGGLSSGLYFVPHPDNWTNLANIYDGNWGTYGFTNIEGQGMEYQQYIYVNYSKPAFREILGVIYEQKDGQTGSPENSTIPASCLAQSVLQTLIEVWWYSNTTSSSNYDCWTGASWTMIEANAMGTQRRTYEEKVWWNFSGVGVQHCWYSLNGGANTTFTNCTSVLVSGLSEGSNTINYWGNDSSGTVSTMGTFTINFVSEAPTLAINLPQDGYNYSSLTQELNITVSDISGVDSCWHSIDNWTNNITWTNTTSRLYTFPNDGSFYLRIGCNDTLGNVNDSEYVLILIDTTNPSLTINLPTPAQNFSVNYVELNVTASDLGIGLDTCWYSNDSWATNITFSNCSSVLVAGFTDGIHTIYIGVNDTLGNENTSESVTFRIDTTEASIEFNTPANGTTINVDYIYGNVTIDDPYGDITFELWDSSGLLNQTNSTTPTTDINWSSLGEGDYWFNVTVNNSAGLVNTSETIYITLDWTNPVIANATSTPPSTYTDWPVVITVDAVDTNLNTSKIIVQITLPSGTLENWTFTSNVGDTYSVTFTNTSLIGNYLISHFWAFDLADNSQELLSTLTIAVSNATGSDVEPGDGGGTPSATTTTTLPEVDMPEFTISPTEIDDYCILPLQRFKEYEFEASRALSWCEIDNPEFTCEISNRTNILVIYVPENKSLSTPVEAILTIYDETGNTAEATINIFVVNLGVRWWWLAPLFILILLSFVEKEEK